MAQMLLAPGKLAECRSMVLSSHTLLVQKNFLSKGTDITLEVADKQLQG